MCAHTREGRIAKGAHGERPVKALANDRLAGAEPSPEIRAGEFVPARHAL